MRADDNCRLNCTTGSRLSFPVEPTFTNAVNSLRVWLESLRVSSLSLWYDTRGLDRRSSVAGLLEAGVDILSVAHLLYIFVQMLYIRHML